MRYRPDMIRRNKKIFKKMNNVFKTHPPIRVKFLNRYKLINPICQVRFNAGTDPPVPIGVDDPISRG
jgi:hypothetical protein